MKKIVYIVSVMIALSSGNVVNAQQNVNNAGFENWQNLGSATEEPNDWNSFKSASGTYAMFAQQQIKRSTQKRPGSPGTYSAVIWAKSISGTLANGNMTTGQVNMGDMSPSGANNYNITRTSDANFSEAYTDQPDTVVFWTKFVPGNSGGSDQARASIIIHDNYDYRDPTTSDGNAPNHVVATAALNFPKTNGQWARKAVALNYSGPSSTPAFILITFSTNMNAGSGTAGDSLYIDDISFTNNTTGIRKFQEDMGLYIYDDPDMNRLVLNFSFDKSLKTLLAVYNITGQSIWNAEKEISTSREYISLDNLNPGIYFLKVSRLDGTTITRKFLVNND